MQPFVQDLDPSFEEISPIFLLRAYQLGVFPMAMEDGEIGWFSPDPRGIIPLDTFRIPHGLKRTLRRGKFEVRFNSAFLDVMLGCADRDSTWIDDRIIRTYCDLHEMGYCHSVETWREDQLVGGLYGVSLKGAFFGESMFTRETDASKVALVALVKRMREHGLILLDTQWSTPHLKTLGCVDIPREEYRELLDRALMLNVNF